MFLFRRPTPQQIDDFLNRQCTLKLTYPAIGATETGNYPQGYLVDHHRFLLGSGEATFEVAKRALRGWKHFQFDWIEYSHPDTEPAAGQSIGILVRAMKLWVLNAARIVYVVEEDHRFAFGYGTLPDHAESGEERFQVEWNREADSVWYDILAFSRPQQFLSKLGYFYTRRKQKQFVRDAGRVMQAVVRNA